MEAAARTRPIVSRQVRVGRRILLGLLVVLVIVGGIAAALLAPGVHQQYGRTALLTDAQRASAPAWTRPCWPTARWTTKSVCVHVEGRVVWIQKHDPDGDGDRHLLVIARLHPRLVKLVRDMPVPTLPRIGSRIDAVGWLMHGASGRAEVLTQRFRWAGHTAYEQTG
jgi:hypothetical protein